MDKPVSLSNSFMLMNIRSLDIVILIYLYTAERTRSSVQMETNRLHALIYLLYKHWSYPGLKARSSTLRLKHWQKQPALRQQSVTISFSKLESVNFPFYAFIPGTNTSVLGPGGHQLLSEPASVWWCSFKHTGIIPGRGTSVVLISINKKRRVIVSSQMRVKKST